MFVQFVVLLSWRCAFGLKNLTWKNALCPWHQISLALISARSSTDKFPPIDCSSPVQGCNIGFVITSFVTSCNISPVLSRNSLCLKVTNPFGKIAHTGLCKFLNDQWLGSRFSVLKEVLEVHIVDRLHPRILLLIMKTRIV